MATHDYNLANASGASFRADLNNALQAILTNNSSASAPSTTAAYMFWADTNTGILKIRNSANDAWIELLQLDGTLTLEDGSASAVALGFRDELNTGIFSSGANNFDVSIAGTTRLNISASGINITGTVTDDGATHDGDVTFTGASANIVFDKSDNALEFADNAKAKFGNAGDLEIYHSGNNTIINDAGAGELILQRGGSDILALSSVGINITDPNGEAIVQVTGFEGSDAAVQLMADQGDDNGDRWKLVAVASDNTFRLQNNVSGSNVTKWTIGTDGDVRQEGKLEVRDAGADGIISRSTATQSTDTNKGLKVRNNSDTDTFSVSYKGEVYSAGRVGIGESDPDVSIHVKESSPRIHLEDTGTDAIFRINADSSVGNAALDVDINSATSTPSLIFNIKGGEKMRLTSGGNLGIGLTSPAERLTVDGGIRSTGTAPNISFLDTNASTDNKQWDFKTSGDNFVIQCLNDSGAGGGNLFLMTRSGNALQTFEGQKGGTTWFTVDNNNRLLTTRSLTVSVDATVSGRIVVANNSASFPSYSFTNSNTTGFYRLDSNQIGVSCGGTGRYAFTNNRFGPQIDDDADLGSNSIKFDNIFATSGTVTASDQNTKNTIATSDLGLDFINRLNPVSYKFNGKTRTHYGLIAQEIETVLGAISKPATDFAGFCKDEKDDDGVDLETPLYGLRYTEFIAPIIKALQELSAKVTALEGS